MGWFQSQLQDPPTPCGRPSGRRGVQERHTPRPCAAGPADRRTQRPALGRQCPLSPSCGGEKVPGGTTGDENGLASPLTRHEPHRAPVGRVGVAGPRPRPFAATLDNLFHQLQQERQPVPQATLRRLVHLMGR